jgi:hypothetical protein
MSLPVQQSPRDDTIALVAIFTLDVPFPLINLAAGLIGLLGRRLERSELRVGGGHGASGGKVLADADSLLGQGTLVHGGLQGTATREAIPSPPTP